MDMKFKNITTLNLDIYMEGIKESYRLTHRISRAFSYAYAIIMLVIACAFFLSADRLIGVFFLLFFLVIFFWNLVGYRLGTKGSFLDFAKLHGSHYQVEMEYRFYEDRLEQETDKTELTVLYNKIDVVYVTDKLILIIFDKKVIIIDKLSFIDCKYQDVIKFIQQNNVKVTYIRRQVNSD